MNECVIYTADIRLDALLKFAGICDTGGQAKIWVQDGRVFVNGVLCTQRTKKILPGDVIRAGEGSFKVVKS